MRRLQPYFRLGLAITVAIAMVSSTFDMKADAAAVSFTPQPQLNGGTILGRVPLAKLGNLNLPRGRAYFKSNLVEITAIPEWQFDREQVLSGPILKCWSTIDGKNASINGIAYFQDGEWLKYIDENTPDKVITKNDAFTGQITAMKNGFLEITPDYGTAKQVAIADVEQIISPRAYLFSLPVAAFLSVPQGAPISGETTTVTLKPTTTMITLAAVKRDPLMRGDGDVSTTKLTALWAGISAIELLQTALPMGILYGPVNKEMVRQYHARMNTVLQYSNQPTLTGATFQNSPSLAPSATPSLLP